jgi:predicted alternative tryptophan synthase beta-subunit
MKTFGAIQIEECLITKAKIFYKEDGYTKEVRAIK